MVTAYVSSRVHFALMCVYFIFLFDHDVVYLVSCCISCQLSSIGHLLRWQIRECFLDIEGTGEIKYPGLTWKPTYDGLPRGNHDLGRSGNCKREAALAKVTIGGDGVISIAIDQKQTGEDGSQCIGCRTAMWKERRNHHIMISKQQPKY